MAGQLKAVERAPANKRLRNHWAGVWPIGELLQTIWLDLGNGRDLTRRFTDLAAAVAGLKPATLILDGEIAVFDRHLVSHFEWLRGRPKDEPATPPTLIAFDCLYSRGRDLRERPLHHRREVLEDVIEGETAILPARRLSADGLEAWVQVIERGYEGLVGKDEASPYREGRTLAWLKVKVPHYRDGERGWEPERDACPSKDRLTLRIRRLDACSRSLNRPGFPGDRFR